MKKTISIILLLAMLLSASTIPAFAEVNPSIYGDVDASGTVNSSDALLALQFSVTKITLNSVQKKYADVNVDKAVTASDALLILQYSVKKISKLPTVETMPYDLLIDKPDSLLNNGAYEEDLTADCSFHVDTTGLAENTIYLISNSVYSQNNSIITKDYARFVFSLQGIINRDFGITHTSLLYFNSDQQDKDWLAYMMESGKFYEEYNTVTISSFDVFMQTFKAQIEDCGIILWDPNVPSTANVAGTICGLDGFLPVKYDTSASRSFYNKLMEYKDQCYIIEEKETLVGLFEDAKLNEEKNIKDTKFVSSGSSKCDAYLWALEKYMDRCSSKYIGYIVDGAVNVSGNPLTARADATSPVDTCLFNHDYLIARRCFFFDLTCYPAEKPCDDPDQPDGTDEKTLYKILDARYTRANGTFGQILGFPPWWLKYTDYSSLGSLPATTLERMSVEYFTTFNLAMEADAAGPCSMTNGSAYYKYVSVTEKFENNPASENVVYNPNTYYYVIYLGDYDSSAWLKKHINNFWKDTARGTIPLMWSFNPNLSDRVPMIFDYVYEKKTSKDFFEAGEGAGYIIPSALFKGHNIYGQIYRTKEDGDKAWISYAKDYYKVFDMDITGFIINGDLQITKKIADVYNILTPVGSFHNSYLYKLMKHGSSYYIYLQNGVSTAAEDLDQTVQTVYNHAAKQMNNYKFSAFRTVCGSPTEISNLVTALNQYASDRGKTFKYVDPYTYFRLLGESYVAPDSSAYLK